MKITTLSPSPPSPASLALLVFTGCGDPLSIDHQELAFEWGVGMQVDGELNRGLCLPCCGVDTHSWGGRRGERMVEPWGVFILTSDQFHRHLFASQSHFVQLTPQ